MKIYTTQDKEGKREIFYSASAAKDWMKAHEGSTGTITKVYANGDWEPCGEIKLKGRNSVRMSNQATSTY